MMTDLERQRRHRARQRAGLVPLRVDVPEVDTIELLLSAGLLRPEQVDDRGAIAVAVAAQWQLLLRFPR